ncbi:MAG: glycosyltransferase family 1 protein [Solirubrobacteraceae bacterium]|nr:glycosyltransferase family 1 protein [Solirubrobacteraceae bacterium]
MTLTIAIDARPASDEGAGVGRVVRELLRALARRDDDHRYRLYARTAWPEPLDERFSWHCNGSRDPLWHLRASIVASRACDVFLATGSYLPAWFASVPVAPVVYDLVPFDRRLLPQRRARRIARLTLGPAVRRADALICISQATADDLVTHFPRARDKTVVALLGVAPVLADAATQLPAGVPDEGFVLAVGTLEPRKNLPRLVAAYERLPEDLRAAHPLVVTGKLGWDAGETLAALDSLDDHAIRTGFVPDAQLALLYRRCALFAYPSLGEGFGLPVLEALAAGAPVLTSNRSSLPEVGGEAVAYCDPTETDSIARELELLLRDPARRARMAAAGPPRAAGFSWDRTAQIVLERLERIAGGVRR